MEEVTSSLVLDNEHVFSAQELCAIGDVSIALIQEMVEYGLLDPIGVSPAEWYFPASALSRLLTALRISQDLGINWQGIALAMDLLDEVQVLRNKLSLFENF